jgi:hypothetical protein
MSKSHETVVDLFIRHCSLERGLDVTVLRAVFRDFMKCLNESQFKSGYRTEDGSVLNQIYSALGQEAAYHFCGLLANSGRGHDGETVVTALEYQDPRAKRFGTTVERWQFECDSEIAQQEPI